ncbi:hypothetical protein GCM10027169_24200 [Gordonia jinhuaensis]
MHTGLAGGIDQIDHIVEGQITDIEVVDIDGAHPREIVAHRQHRIDVGAQHHGVDEQPDQRVQPRITASGHRRADRDVVGTRQPGHDGGDRRMGDHEQGGVVRRRELTQSRDVGAAEAHLCAVHAAVAGSVATVIGGENRCGGHPVEQCRPAIPQPLRVGARLSRRAEELLGPHRVIAVIDVRGDDLRCLAGHPGPIAGHQVGGQRRQRPAVHADVVGRNGQHVFGIGVGIGAVVARHRAGCRADLVQPYAHTRFASEVEGTLHELRHRGEYGVADRDSPGYLEHDRIELPHHAGRVHHDLLRIAGHFRFTETSAVDDLRMARRIDGVQRGMSCDHVDQRRPQRRGR